VGAGLEASRSESARAVIVTRVQQVNVKCLSILRRICVKDRIYIRRVESDITTGQIGISRTIFSLSDWIW
jgi:hypothetical protein